MSVDPVDNNGIITYLGAPSVRGEAPVEKLQLTGHEWVGFAFNLCFGVTPGMIVYRAADQGDQTRSDWIALPPSGVPGQVLTNGTGNQVLWGAGGGGGISLTATTPIVVTPDPITGSGDVSHALSGVVADTYGSSTFVPQFTVDETGHITAVTEVAISGGGGCDVTLNPQTGTTYTLQETDACALTTFSNAASIAVTVPDAGSGGNFLSGWHAYYKNIGEGFVTFTLSTSLADGESTISLAKNQTLEIISNGTNYDLFRGTTGGSGPNSSLVGGSGNSIDDSAGVGETDNSGIFAGSGNTIGPISTAARAIVILGGTSNTIATTSTSDNNAILAGHNNLIDADESDDSVIIGGHNNKVHGHQAAVIGGVSNEATTESVIAGGRHNISTGTNFIGGGEGNNFSGVYTASMGGYFAGDNARSGANLLGGGSLDLATPGQAQIFRTVLRATSPDTTPVRLTWNAESVSEANIASPPNNTAALLNLYLIGRQGTTDQVVLTCLGALLSRGANAAATSIIGAPSFTVASATAGAVGTTAALTADTTLGGANITVTPPTSADWTWVCLYEAVEIA